MWPRVAEMVLGAWLAASPALLAPVVGTPWIEVGAGAAVVLLGAVALRPPRPWLRHAHAATLAVALLLLAAGWLITPRPGPAAAQNRILVGLLLALFALAPTHAERPPPTWRHHVGGGGGS